MIEFMPLTRSFIFRTSTRGLLQAYGSFVRLPRRNSRPSTRARLENRIGASHMIIDCHCHAGKGDIVTAPWNTDAPLEPYLRRARTAGIDRTVVLRCSK